MKNINKLKEIIFPIEKELCVFEKKLKDIISLENNFLKEDLLNFMFSNPKRLRPIFIYLFSKILKIENNEIVDNISLATEIIHNASLIHDDIIDEEKIRRDNPTIHAKFNSKIAVLGGDLLLSCALNVLSKTSLEILDIFSKKIKDTILGELNQNLNIDKITTIDEYLNKTFAKTGNLFFAGLNSLFTLKKIDKQIEQNLLNFLKNYTLAFQIKNDTDNISNNSSDIKNGNYTLAVIYYYLENSAFDKEKINKQNLEKYINQAYLKVNEYKKEAIKYFEKIENSQYKTALLQLCELTLRS